MFDHARSRIFTRPVFTLIVLVLLVRVLPAAAQTTPEATEAAFTFPLAERGTYSVGFSNEDYVDSNRGGRYLETYVWYPALASADMTQGQQDYMQDYGWKAATPDSQSAPYPLIVISPGWYGTSADFIGLALVLASHGYVVASIRHPDEDSPLSFVDRPMDVQFVLEQLAESNSSDFGGVIDMNHVGVMGRSYGAYTTLAMTGARIDPALGKALTAKPNVSSGFNDIDLRNLFPEWDWDTIAAYRAKLSPSPSEGQLWPPITAPGIQAAVMWSPCEAAYFGDKGLAAATVPSLIIDGTSDDVCPYKSDSLYTYTNLGSKERYLLSVVNGQHIPDFGDPAIAQLYTAFFDVYLKGRQDEAQDLTADYVNSIEAQLKLGLMWGPYNQG